MSYCNKATSDNKQNNPEMLWLNQCVERKDSPSINLKGKEQVEKGDNFAWFQTKFLTANVVELHQSKTTYLDSCEGCHCQRMPQINQRLLQKT